CGVSPHSLATLTIITTLPLYSARSTSLPEMDFILKPKAAGSWALAEFKQAATIPASSSVGANLCIKALLVVKRRERSVGIIDTRPEKAIRSPAQNPGGQSRSTYLQTCPF